MDSEISLKEIFLVLSRRWRAIVLFVLVSTAVSYVVCLFSTKIYRAEVTLLPGGGSGVAANPLAGIPGLGGLMSGGMGWAASNRLAFIVKSRTFKERFVESFDLVDDLYPHLWDGEKKVWKVPKAPTVEDAAGLLSGMIEVEEAVAERALILKVESANARLATDIVNNLVVELDDFIEEHEMTKAKRSRLFIEQQLVENRRELLETGRALLDYYDRYRVSSSAPKVDVDVGINEPASDPSQKYAFVEGSLSMEASDALGNRISHLTEQKEEIKKKLRGVERVRDLSPQLHYEYLSMQKSILQSLNFLLSQQHAMAKTEEANEEIFFTVIDNARVPGGPVKPETRFIMSAVFALTLLLGIFFVLFMAYYRKSHASSS